MSGLRTLHAPRPAGGIPNHPHLPALVLPGAVLDDPAPERVLGLYASTGWCRSWTWTVFDYHHYHPNAHEVLTCTRGWADLTLGGPGGPTVRVSAGDTLLLPAGFGHCNTASGDDFSVCGAYPPGQPESAIIARADAPRAAAQARIASVPLPATDPIFGPQGPFLAAWTAIQEMPPCPTA